MISFVSLPVNPLLFLVWFAPLYIRDWMGLLIMLRFMLASESLYLSAESSSMLCL